MLFDSDWRDWLSQWDANEATTGNRHTGFPDCPTTTETTAAILSSTGPAVPVPPAAPSTPVENPISIFTPPNAIPAAAKPYTTPSVPDPRYATTTGPLLSLDDALAATLASAVTSTKPSKAPKTPEVQEKPKAPKKQKEPKKPVIRTGTPKRTKKHLIYAAALLAPTLILALGVGLGLTHNHNTKDTQVALTTTTVAPVVKQWCTPQPANPYISNAGGNITTPEGLLATMEQQYFGTRSAPAVMALISGGWADAEAVASTIDSLPKQPLEWCTTIHTAEPGWYTVIVDWRTKGDEHHNTTWVGDYHIENLPGVGLRITGMRPNLTIVQELRKKEEAEKAAKEASAKAAAE